MEVYIDKLVETIKTMLDTYPPFVGIFLGTFIVFSESIIPVLPLCVFVTLNVIIFGNIVGILISYIGTVIGCLTSFAFFRHILSDKLYKKIENNEKLKKLMIKISEFNFSTLVVLMAFPFTPAFSVNIASGLSKMSYKKFILACLIAKLPMIYFWGYVGTTLIESLTNPYALINIAVILIITYVISRLFKKKFDI